MNDSASDKLIQFVKTLHRYTQGWDWEHDKTFDGESRFGEEIKQLGCLNVIKAVFLESNHTHPESLMLSFTFMWRDLPFTHWLALTRCLSNERYGKRTNYAALYDFAVFAGRFLSIDICNIIATDTQISPAAKTAMARAFQHGTPVLELNWVSDSLKDAGIDPQTMWQRLEREGAPMKPPHSSGST